MACLNLFVLMMLLLLERRNDGKVPILPIIKGYTLKVMGISPGKVFKATDPQNIHSCALFSYKAWCDTLQTS